MKIAICVPVYGDTKGKFTQSLCNMLIHFLSANITTPDGVPIEREVEVFMVSCSMLTESRHRLVAESLAWGADYMLWLDADHTFPPDTLARLWSQNKAVIGANYARRFAPTAPTAARGPQLIYTTEEMANEGLVEQVDHLGFGICLMDMRIFDALQAKAEADGDGNFLPLFKFETAENGVGVIGEDVFFFKKLRECGIEVFCDHRLSWEVGHLHEFPIFLRAALNQRDDWVKFKDSTGAKFVKKAEELEAAEG